MAVAEQILQRVQRLPSPLQTEVLHYVEYLLTKVEEENWEGERQDWSNLSLSLAMRGMEDEDADYDESDLKESFS